MVKTSAQTPTSKSTIRRYGFGLIILLLAVYILTPQYSALMDGAKTLQSAYLPYLGLGLVFWLFTFVSAAGVYQVLSRRHLHYRQTLIVQIASGFTNRLAPAGAGSLVINAKYLVIKGSSKLEATTIVITNNIAGFISNVLLLLLFIIDDDKGLLSNLVTEFRLHVLMITVISLAALVLLGYLARNIWSKYVTKFFKTLKSYAVSPSRGGLSILVSAATTIAYTFCLIVVGLSLNVHLTVFEGLLVLSSGVFVGALTPAPGGLGGAEAGLAATMIYIGVPAHQALALTLAYRLITYWLPVIPGYVALRYAQQKKYL